MAKKPSSKKKTKAERPFPTREQIIQYIAENPGTSGKRDIARAFGITGGARIALKALLKSLLDEGLVDKKRRRLRRPEDLPSVSVLVVTGRDKDGELLAEPAEWPEEHGPLPQADYPRRPARQVPRRPALATASLPASRPMISDGPHAIPPEIIKILEARPLAVLGVVRIGQRSTPASSRSTRSRRN